MVFAQPEAEPGEEPTGILRKEHNIIGKIAAEAADTAANIRATGKIDTERIEKLHDFFKNFADRCHHAKEERELFPVLREEKVDSVILDLLILQHKEGRVLLAGIETRLSEAREEVTETGSLALARYLEEYARLMEHHIDTENQYLWGKAVGHLSPQQKEKLIRAFQRIEQEELGAGFHEKYHSMAMELLGNASE